MDAEVRVVSWVVIVGFQLVKLMAFLVAPPQARRSRRLGGG